ncbi:hypothetical protein ABTA37_19900, partial [Acinetobacter baumannii]
AFIVFSDRDPIVQPSAQMFSIKGTKKLNGAVEPGTPLSDSLVRYPGTVPTFVYTHPHGHNFQQDTTPLVVDFFRSLP